MNFFNVIFKYLRLYSGWTMAEQQPGGCWPVLDHAFGPSIGVALLDHEFGPSVGVGLFFGAPERTFWRSKIYISNFGPSKFGPSIGDALTSISPSANGIIVL